MTESEPPQAQRTSGPILREPPIVYRRFQSTTAGLCEPQVIRLTTPPSLLIVAEPPASGTMVPVTHSSGTHVPFGPVKPKGESVSYDMRPIAPEGDESCVG